ncbi:MAG TPA: hypothetical protein DEV59_01390 [Proteus sp.]|nr:hypothetical protein [Proteus sp. (in: enterobacteria)]
MKTNVIAHSQSINKIVSKLKDELDLSIIGVTPTEKLTNSIEQLKIKLKERNENDLSELANNLIQTAFETGVHSGFKRALERIQDGKIEVRKIRNEDLWQLYSYSQRYQITENIPAMDKEYQKVVTHVVLSTFGFK